jgi:cell division protein ZapA
MADVTLQVAGRTYVLACKDGGEAHLSALGAEIDAKAQRLLDQLGPMAEGRLMLMSALLLADELKENRQVPAPTPAPMPGTPDAGNGVLTETLAALTARAEALVARLEADNQP